MPHPNPIARFPKNTTLAVLADTHIPDRTTQLPPAVFDIFQNARARAILHAGDVTSPRVLEQLRRIAPVYAVRGNLDFFLRLPPVLWFTLGPYRLVLLHGHHGLLPYLRDKIRFHLGFPLAFRDLESRAFRRFPLADVVIMGHTHAPVLWSQEGRWLFNPGSPTIPPGGAPPQYPRTVGLIHLDARNRLHFEWVHIEP